MQAMDDLELLRQYPERNSEAAFDALVNRYLNLVYSAALRQVREPAAAADVTQTVFIILGRKARPFKDRTVLSGWLYRTAQFAGANVRRSECRRRGDEQEDAQQDPDENNSAT